MLPGNIWSLLMIRVPDRILRKIVPVLLITSALILGYKYIVWNWYKVEDNIALIKNIAEAPKPEVFKISRDKSDLYIKVFKYREDGCYLTGDVPEGILKSENISFSINGKELKPIVKKRNSQVLGFADGKRTYTIASERLNREEFIKIYRELRGIR